MGKHIKKLTSYQLAVREQIENELASIPKQDPKVAKITSAEGFAEYYMRMQHLYNTREEAYERLEEFHIAIIGKRRYSEFDSFRSVLIKRDIIF